MVDVLTRRFEMIRYIHSGVSDWMGKLEGGGRLMERLNILTYD